MPLIFSLEKDVPACSILRPYARPGGGSVAGGAPCSHRPRPQRTDDGAGGGGELGLVVAPGGRTARGGPRKQGGRAGAALPAAVPEPRCAGGRGRGEGARLASRAEPAPVSRAPRVHPERGGAGTCRRVSGCSAGENVTSAPTKARCGGWWKPSTATRPAAWSTPTPSRSCSRRSSTG